MSFDNNFSSSSFSSSSVLPSSNLFVSASICDPCTPRSPSPSSLGSHERLDDSNLFIMQKKQAFSFVGKTDGSNKHVADDNDEKLISEKNVENKKCIQKEGAFDLDYCCNNYGNVVADISSTFYSSALPLSSCSSSTPSTCAESPYSSFSCSENNNNNSVSREAVTQDDLSSSSSASCYSSSLSHLSEVSALCGANFTLPLRTYTLPEGSGGNRRKTFRRNGYRKSLYYNQNFFFKLIPPLASFLFRRNYPPSRQNRMQTNKFDYAGKKNDNYNNNSENVLNEKSTNNNERSAEEVGTLEVKIAKKNVSTSSPLNSTHSAEMRRGKKHVSYLVRFVAFSIVVFYLFLSLYSFHRTNLYSVYKQAVKNSNKKNSSVKSTNNNNMKVKSSPLLYNNGADILDDKRYGALTNKEKERQEKEKEENFSFLPRIGSSSPSRSAVLSTFFPFSFFFPFIYAEASLNIHPSIPDFVVSGSRDFMYVDAQQTVPQDLVMPSCSSLNGPTCSFLQFEHFDEDYEVEKKKKRKNYKKAEDRTYYLSFVHRLPDPSGYSHLSNEDGEIQEGEQEADNTSYSDASSCSSSSNTDNNSNGGDKGMCKIKEDDIHTPEKIHTKNINNENSEVNGPMMSDYENNKKKYINEVVNKDWIDYDTTYIHRKHSVYRELYKHSAPFPYEPRAYFLEDSVGDTGISPSFTDAISSALDAANGYLDVLENIWDFDVSTPTQTSDNTYVDEENIKGNSNNVGFSRGGGGGIEEKTADGDGRTSSNYSVSYEGISHVLKFDEAFNEYAHDWLLSTYSSTLPADFDPTWTGSWRVLATRGKKYKDKYGLKRYNHSLETFNEDYHRRSASYFLRSFNTENENSSNKNTHDVYPHPSPIYIDTQFYAPHTNAGERVNMYMHANDFLRSYITSYTPDRVDSNINSNNIHKNNPVNTTYGRNYSYADTAIDVNSSPYVYSDAYVFKNQPPINIKSYTVLYSPEGRIKIAKPCVVSSLYISASIGEFRTKDKNKNTSKKKTEDAEEVEEEIKEDGVKKRIHKHSQDFVESNLYIYISGFRKGEVKWKARIPFSRLYNSRNSKRNFSMRFKKSREDEGTKETGDSDNKSDEEASSFMEESEWIDVMSYVTPTPYFRIDTVRFEYVYTPYLGEYVGLTQEQTDRLNNLMALGMVVLNSAKKVYENKYAVESAVPSSPSSLSSSSSSQRAGGEIEEGNTKKAAANAHSSYKDEDEHKKEEKSDSVNTSDANEKEDSWASYAYAIIIRVLHDNIEYVVDNPLNPMHTPAELLQGLNANSREYKRLLLRSKRQMKKFDSLNTDLIDLRIPAKNLAVYLQKVPIESPLVSLNEMLGKNLLLYRKLSSISKGSFQNLVTAGDDYPSSVSPEGAEAFKQALQSLNRDYLIEKLSSAAHKIVILKLFKKHHEQGGAETIAAAMRDKKEELLGHIESTIDSLLTGLRNAGGFGGPAGGDENAAIGGGDENAATGGVDGGREGAGNLVGNLRDVLAAAARGITGEAGGEGGGAENAAAREGGGGEVRGAGEGRSIADILREIRMAVIRDRRGGEEAGSEGGGGEAGGEGRGGEAGGEGGGGTENAATLSGVNAGETGGRSEGVDDIFGRRGGGVGRDGGQQGNADTGGAPGGIDGGEIAGGETEPIEMRETRAPLADDIFAPLGEPATNRHAGEDGEGGGASPEVYMSVAVIDGDGQNVGQMRLEDLISKAKIFVVKNTKDGKKEEGAEEEPKKDKSAAFEEVMKMHKKIHEEVMQKTKTLHESIHKKTIEEALKKAENIRAAFQKPPAHPGDTQSPPQETHTSVHTQSYTSSETFTHDGSKKEEPNTAASGSSEDAKYASMERETDRKRKAEEEERKEENKNEEKGKDVSQEEKQTAEEDSNNQEAPSESGEWSSSYRIKFERKKKPAASSTPPPTPFPVTPDIAASIGKLFENNEIRELAKKIEDALLKSNIDVTQMFGEEQRLAFERAFEADDRRKNAQKAAEEAERAKRSTKKKSDE